MKKQFFMLLAGAAALTSCTSTDVLQEGPQSNVIGFENVVNKSARADGDPVQGDINLGNFNHFAVYGYYTKNDAVEKVFDNQLVSKQETGWTYSPQRYWNPGATYNFYAYSCADVMLGEGKGAPQFTPEAAISSEDAAKAERALKIIGYTCDATHQHDLICSSVEGLDAMQSGNSNVKFTFRHALCKVCAEFVNDFPGDYDMTITDVKILNFYNKANLNVREVRDITLTANDNVQQIVENVWYGATRPTEGMTTLALPDAGDNTTGTVYMIPAYYDNANVSLEFTLTLSKGDKEVFTRAIRGSWKPVWVAGRIYKYTIHINGTNSQLEPIVFETSQAIADQGTQGWTSEGSTDMTFTAPYETGSGNGE